MSFWRRLFRIRPRVCRPVRFYTRDHCPLCDEAMAILQKYAGRHRLDIRVINIAQDPELERLYGTEIPVVFIDDRKRFFGHVDEVLLRRILESSPPRPE